MELIRSPDGRVWTLDPVKPTLRDAETFKVPFFWASVVATILLLRPESDIKGAVLVRSG